MASIADIKMAALAALIVLTTLFCTQNNETLADGEQNLPHTPLIEKQVLMG